MRCPFCSGDYEYWDSVLQYHDLLEGVCHLCEKGEVTWRVWLHYHLVNFLDWMLYE